MLLPHALFNCPFHRLMKRRNKFPIFMCILFQNHSADKTDVMFTELTVSQHNYHQFNTFKCCLCMHVLSNVCKNAHFLHSQFRKRGSAAVTWRHKSQGNKKKVLFRKTQEDSQRNAFLTFLWIL